MDIPAECLDFLMEAEETDSQDQKIFTKQPPYLTAENNDHPEPDVEPEKTESKSLLLVIYLHRASFLQQYANFLLL